MPFIHVTTSATLVGLEKTGYRLVCLSDLLFKYHFAPIAGEISMGGTAGPINAPGVAFADVTSTYWPAESLLRSYGSGGWEAYYSSLAEMEDDIEKLIKNKLSTLNSIIVNLMRDIQKGQAIQLPEELKARLIQKIDFACEEVRRLYLRNYILPVYFKYQSKGIKGYRIQADFMNYLLEKIPLDFFKLPEEEKEAFISCFPAYFKEICKARRYPMEYVFSEYFSKTIPNEQIKTLNEYRLATALMDPTRNDFIDYYMHEREDDSSVYTLDCEKLSSIIENACDTLSQRIELLKILLNTRGAQEMTAEEKLLCTNSYPIVFILEDDTKLENLGQEFRAHTDLKLGIDILRIATTSQHFSQVQAFLWKANLDNVKIISIDDLKTKPKLHTFFGGSSNQGTDPFAQPMDLQFNA